MLTREFFTADLAAFTVTPPANFVRVRELLGSPYHSEYSYQIERVGTAHYVRVLTGSRFVYLGALKPETGEVTLTAKSAFPATATRVKVIQRVLAAIWQGRGDAITKAEWRVEPTATPAITATPKPTPTPAREWSSVTAEFA